MADPGPAPAGDFLDRFHAALAAALAPGASPAAADALVEGFFLREGGGAEEGAGSSWLLGPARGQRWTPAALRAALGAGPGGGGLPPALLAAAPRGRRVADAEVLGLPLALVDEELSAEAAPQLRGSAVLLRVDGDWRVLLYHLSYAVSNDLAGAFGRFCARREGAAAASAEALSCASAGGEASPALAGFMSGRFHPAAAAAQLETFLGCFASQGHFLGTDATENWGVPELEEFARGAFKGKRGKGWDYRMLERAAVEFRVAGVEIALVDELLENVEAGSIGLADATFRASSVAMRKVAPRPPNDSAEEAQEDVAADAIAEEGAGAAGKTKNKAQKRRAKAAAQAAAQAAAEQAQAVAERTADSEWRMVQYHLTFSLGAVEAARFGKYLAVLAAVGGDRQ